MTTDDYLKPNTEFTESEYEELERKVSDELKDTIMKNIYES